MGEIERAAKCPFKKIFHPLVIQYYTSRRNNNSNSRPYGFGRRKMKVMGLLMVTTEVFQLTGVENLRKIVTYTQVMLSVYVFIL